MKRLLAITNALLAVIAVCLCLTVAKLYDFSLAPVAHAQSSSIATKTSTPLAVRVVNTSLPCTVEGTVDARMHLYDIGWSPVKGRYGALVVEQQE